MFDHITGIHHLLHFALLQFLQIEGLWQPSIEQVCQCPFFQQHVLTLCLCHTLVILTIFQISSFLLCLLW